MRKLRCASASIPQAHRESLGKSSLPESSGCRAPLGRSCSAPYAGLTLVEVLVALAVSGVILAVAGSMLTGFLVNSKKQEMAQSLREASNRLNYLVQTEASEAREIALTAPASWPSGCGTKPADSDVLFSYVVPETVGEYGTDANSLSITYYRNSGNVMRCGPNTQPNGELVHGTVNASTGAYTAPGYSSGVAMRSTAIVVISGTADVACGAEVTSARTLVFRTSFSSAPWTPECTVARAKTVFVCNPPSAEMIALKTPGSSTYDPAYDYPVGTCRS